MSDHEEIRNDYESILSIAKEYDSCSQKEKPVYGKPAYSIKNSLSETYWNLRRDLEERITKLMRDIRKAINSIPLSMKNTTERESYDEYGNVVTEKSYDNRNFKLLLNFYYHIEEVIEDSEGVIDRIIHVLPIESRLRNIRGVLLSFLKTIELLIPEEMISTEKEVTIILALEEKGMEKPAEELESIIKTEKGRDKCLRARTSLEQVLVNLLEIKNVKRKKRSFYSNLHQCLKNDLIDKDLEKTIGTHYSFISKICHSEIEDSVSNVQFAIKNIFLIIEKIIGLNNKT